MRSHGLRGLRATFLRQAALAGVWLVAACGGVDQDLRTATQLYADARYEAVQAWIAQLRGDYPDMDARQRAEFHYLSGMTAYRLSQPDEALHELALAAHAAREQQSGLRSEQLALLYRTLEELTARSAARTQ
jgi:hypothetical protein